MKINAARFERLLSEGKLEKLFIDELGWDRAALRPYTVSVEGNDFVLTALAQKRGVAILRCSPDAHGMVPTRAVQMKLEKAATKLAHEHLLIFADASNAISTWLWVLRAPGQPTATRTHTWRRGSSGESLRQKLEQIVWSLEAEDAITLTDVIKGLRSAFDRESVSREFFQRFTEEHDAFKQFVLGLKDQATKAWYASLMLNRLMFVYFIQRKGFLDGDHDYLANRLRDVQAQAGKGKFHSFYRQFLRRLFHEGLGRPKVARDLDLARLVGDVPYLNGGLFAEHQLEEANPDIDIPDDAFERLFRFFDAYDWHLDDRPLSKGNEINPDVLGYIFERYINQKQMGAYYTKEDITEYISKNTIIAHLLEGARGRCSAAFEGEQSVWKILAADPHRYVNASMKVGVIDANGGTISIDALPAAVRRWMTHDGKNGNSRMLQAEASFEVAPGERGTLAGETWMEYVARRDRCLATRKRLSGGDICSVDEMITLNLDVRQFMQDVIDNCEGADLLRAIWHGIVGRPAGFGGEPYLRGITVLDPTCGSGAFLFAALNVLEPLYEACLDRMEGFVDDSMQLSVPVDEEFKRVLDEVAKHSSRRYYIYKTIVLNNLFGVDIMDEAVEICKLRLFLKLVSQVQDRNQLEPLPDIDFNIRAGNTLIGYASEVQFDAARDLASDQTHAAEIKAGIAELATLFEGFRAQQTTQHEHLVPANKRALRLKLNELGAELNRYIARDHGVNPDLAKPYKAWLSAHQPFHWFAEFYAVMRDGGFNVIVGNPPYVEIPQEFSRPVLSGLYRTALARWSRDEDLYTLVMERSLSLLSARGKMGLIVPLSLASSTKRSFIAMREVMMAQPGTWWWSHYDRIPSALFGNEVRTRCTIALYSRMPDTAAGFTSALMRWTSEERGTLFERLRYAAVAAPISEGIPKLGSEVQAEAFKSLATNGHRLAEDLRDSISFAALLGAAPNFPSNSVFVGGLAYNWFPAWRSIPPTTTARGEASVPARAAGFRFATQEDADAVFALLCSSLGYWWWAVASDGFNLKRWLIERFPVSLRSLTATGRKEMAGLGRQLAEELEGHYVFKENKGRIGNYYLPACQGTVDMIDASLAKHVPGLSPKFFEDLQRFNASFSTAQVEGEGGDEED